MARPRSLVLADLEVALAIRCLLSLAAIVSWGWAVEHPLRVPDRNRPLGSSVFRGFPRSAGISPGSVPANCRKAPRSSGCEPARQSSPIRAALSSPPAACSSRRTASRSTRSRADRRRACGRPAAAPARSLAWSKRWRSPPPLSTQAASGSARSKVVKRSPHPGQLRRRRTAAPPSARRVSSVRVCCPQEGQSIAPKSTRYGGSASLDSMTLRTESSVQALSGSMDRRLTTSGAVPPGPGDERLRRAGEVPRRELEGREPPGDVHDPPLALGPAERALGHLLGLSRPSTRPMRGTRSREPGLWSK